MAVSKPRIRLYGALLACNLIVFALSAHVNSFHGFFYVADLFPFAMSICTFVLVGATLLGDLKGSNPLLSRPMVELGWLALLAVVWVCTNAFSSSRWRFVQASDCGAIPAGDDLSSVAVWCKEVQALRSFVWIEWVLVVGTLFWLWLYTSREAARGNRRIWSTSFARPAKKSHGLDLNYPGGGRRSLGAMSTGATSSFVTGEDESRYSTQSQTAALEHWQNTHNEYVPSHAHNGSGSSSQYRQPHYGGEPQQANLGFDLKPGPEQQNYAVHHRSQPSQQSQSASYIFNGYGQAR